MTLLLSLSRYPHPRFLRVAFARVRLPGELIRLRHIVIFDAQTRQPVAHFPFSHEEQPNLLWVNATYVWPSPFSLRVD